VPTQKTGSLWSGAFWMFLLSVLLFWLPFIGPLLAGVVGGKKAGSLGRAVLAAFIPGIIFGILMFMFASAITGIPLIGLIAGWGAMALSMAHIGPLLLGAVVGGIIA
jgi:hypothetical protein